MVAMLGSSPLARGLQWGQLHRLGFGRIIPARAGFTEGAGFFVFSRSDHPRSRGVYVTAMLAAA